MKLRALLVMGSVFAGMNGAAHAQQSLTPLSCSPGSERPRVTEWGLRAASNSIGPYDQDIYSAVGTHSFCVRDNARLRFEGAITQVDQDGGDAQAGVIGLAMPIGLSESFIVSPSFHVGYENLPNDDDQLVTSASVVFENSFSIAEETYLKFALTPEYSTRQSADTSAPGATDDSSAFNAHLSAGFDGRLSQNWRWRLLGGYSSLGGDSIIDHVSSATISLGQSNPDTGGYRWVADLTFQQGDNDYEGVLFGITFVTNHPARAR